MADAELAQSGKIRFAALDGLRGLASLLVVLAHFCSATGVLTPWPGLFNAVLAVVDTFFVLSGFVLTHSFLSCEQRDLPLAPLGLLAHVRYQPGRASGLDGTCSRCPGFVCAETFRYDYCS